MSLFKNHQKFETEYAERLRFKQETQDLILFLRLHRKVSRTISWQLDVGGTYAKYIGFTGDPKANLTIDIAENIPLNHAFGAENCNPKKREEMMQKLVRDIAKEIKQVTADSRENEMNIQKLKNYFLRSPTAWQKSKQLQEFFSGMTQFTLRQAA